MSFPAERETMGQVASSESLGVGVLEPGVQICNQNEARISGNMGVCQPCCIRTTHRE